MLEELGLILLLIVGFAVIGIFIAVLDIDK